MQVGIDLLNISRIDRAISKYGIKLLKRFMHESELLRNTTTQSIAGIWAIKEAVIKVYGQGNMLDICVYYEASGKPFAVYNNEKIAVSVSHERCYVIAIAIKG